MLEAYDNQDYPFDKLVEILFGAQQVEESPYFSKVRCILQNIHEQENTVEKGEIVFIFSREGEKQEGRIQYDAGTYEEDYIKRMSGHYRQIMENSLQNIETKINDITYITEQEKEQLLWKFNSPGEEEERTGNRTALDDYEKQVEKNPDRIYIVARHRGSRERKQEEGGGTPFAMTFRELNKRAGRLARQLRAGGIRADNIVAIMTGRSPEKMIAIMGVLKAGGAYLPIDPTLPQNRIITMLEDSRAAIILTENHTIQERTYCKIQGQDNIHLKPRQTPPRRRITDLDAIPQPDRTAIRFSKYNRYLGYSMVKHSISLEATRGCPFKCIYCHQIFPNKQIARSAQHLFNEVKYYYDQGVRRFSIIDDIFNLDVKNSTAFYRKIIENKMELQLFFTAGLRGDILTQPYIDLMMEAGTISLAPALETASPRLQKITKKNLNIEKLRKNLEYICKKYPYVNLELFTMHGFPTETEEEALATLEFIKSIRWLHFPYINLLRIYAGTAMEEFALQNGITAEEIRRSEDLAYHEFPETIKFDRSFTLEYQARFLNEYFLNKERLLHVLPHQMKILTREELVKKYDSYLPAEIKTFTQLLEFTGIREEELGGVEFLSEERMAVPQLDESLEKKSSEKKTSPGAFRVLLMDLDLLFSKESDILYDLVDEPLGLMYLKTHMEKQLGKRVQVRIVKSRLDFDNYGELKEILEEYRPQVIGVRTLTFFRNFVHKTIAMIRQWGNRMPVIAGGPHATTNYESLLQDKNFDLVVFGEGELTLTELIEKMIEAGGKLPAQETLNEIAGIAFIPKEERETRKPPAREIVLLDETCEETEAVHVIAAGAQKGHAEVKTGEGNSGTGTHERNNEEINRPGNLAYVIYTSGSTGRP
ncbi:MAG: AMP-binding protein, partial [bacterium]|nr:AMP-binding protein [bacterium]